MKEIIPEPQIPETNLDKKSRLREILTLMSTSAPGHNFQGGYSIVRSCFDTVENSVEEAAGRSERMLVVPLEKMSTLRYKDNNIRYAIYNSHVLFLGDNGSIDIRAVDRKFPVTDNLLVKHPNFAQEQMRLIFSKKGADGNTVWT